MGAYKQELISNGYYDMDVRPQDAINLTDLKTSLDEFSSYAREVERIIERHAWDRSDPAEVVRVLDQLDDALHHLRRGIFNEKRTA